MRGPRLGGPLGFSGLRRPGPRPLPFRHLHRQRFQVAHCGILLGDPKLGRSDRFRQMQQLRVAAEVEKHADLPGLRFLGHLEDEGAVSRMAAHDGHEDHPVRGEVALMQRERRRCRPGRVRPGWFLFHKAADAVRALPGRQLLGEACRRLGAAVSVANERPQGGGVDDGCCRHDSSF